MQDGSVYYTNSTYMNVGLPIDPIDRVYREGKFHDMIEAGALTHIWLADARPPKEVIANFVLKTFHNTRNAQIAFSPEFTACNVPAHDAGACTTPARTAARRTSSSSPG